MPDIENAHPTSEQILNHIDIFEKFCMGQTRYSPTQFREINEELSIGAVLMLGRHRYEKNHDGKRLFWKGLDNHEHDLGLTHNANIMRDYPGFNAKKSRSLDNDLVAKTTVIAAPNKKGNISVVTLKDGTTGLGPNYRIALRNATLKMHLTSKFNAAATLVNFLNRFRTLA